MEELTTVKPQEIISSKPRLKIVLFLILGLILAVSLVFLGYQLGLKQDKKQVIIPTPPLAIATPTLNLIATPTVDPTINWKTYNNPNFPLTFKYPQNMSLNIGGGLSLQFLGPNFPEGPHSAFYDAFEVGIFTPAKLENENLLEYVQKQIEKDKKISTETGQDLKETKIGDLSGYVYTFIFEVSYRKLFMQLPSALDKVIPITVNVSDPTGQGYQKTVDLILSSLKFSD